MDIPKKTKKGIFFFNTLDIIKNNIDKMEITANIIRISTNKIENAEIIPLSVIEENRILYGPIYDPYTFGLKTRNKILRNQKTNINTLMSNASTKYFFGLFPIFPKNLDGFKIKSIIPILSKRLIQIFKYLF